MDTATAAPLLGGLDDTQVRHGFIRKVYSILGVQLTMTTIIGWAIVQNGRDLVTKHPSLAMSALFASMVMSIGILCVFMCSPNTMRSTPTNYILLFLFTLAESVLVGFSCIQYTTQSILIVFGITAMVVLSLTIFACQTSYDFTGMGPYLFCALMVLCGISFVMMIGSFMGASGEAFRGLHLLYAGIGALVFSMYIVYDTQLIVGNKHAKHKFEIDDYCMAAISLYIDIIQLFLMLLQLFGERR